MIFVHTLFSHLTHPILLQSIQKKLQRTRRAITTTEDEALKATLQDNEERLKEQLQDISERSSVGSYTLIAAGLVELKDVLKEKKKVDTKRPQSDLQFVLWKAIESRAGGRLDLKQSGLDQTNRAGLTSVENCRKVFAALLGMYPPGHDVHQWLSVETVKWERLGNALFDIGCFLKSQRKREPRLLDLKLLRLYERWEDAFPGKGFNKFHGLFCTVRRFVHSFEMAGRVSEESGEAYNGANKHRKSLVACMPCDERRIEKITERDQGNLKGKVVHSRLQITNGNKGRRKKRGTYKPRTRVVGERNIMRMERPSMVVDGETYIMMESGNLLPSEWQDIFEWFQGGKAPADWQDRFNLTAPSNFTEMDRLNERNSSVL